MRTEIKHVIKRLWVTAAYGVLLGVTPLCVAHAYAAPDQAEQKAPVVQASPSSIAMPVTANATGSAAPVVSSAQNVVGTMTPPPPPGESGPVPSLAIKESAVLSPPPSPDEINATGTTGENPKLPPSVKTTIALLNSSVGRVSVGDLNSARQAIARIELLIELEKKMTELDKVRSEHDKVGGSGISGGSQRFSGGGGIPNPSPMPMPVIAPVAYVEPPVSIDIARITGSAGSYKAVVTSGGSDKILRVGDVVGENEKIVDIDSMGLTTDRKGVRRQIRIKNVDHISGSSP